MKSKLNYLIGISLKRKIKTKWFLVANIVLAIIVLGVINIDSIINAFGGDFNEKKIIYVIDSENIAFDIFKEQLDSSSKTVNQNDESSYKIEQYDDTIENAKKELEKEKKAMIIVFEKSLESTLLTTIITREYMDLVDTQLVTNSINSAKVMLAIKDSNISTEELDKIYSSAVIERVYLDENKNSKDENMEIIMTTVFPAIILPFFMLTIFLVQMIGAEVNDEKTTRGMEIIISNVSPKTHFFAKVIAGNLFIIMQGLLLFGYGVMGLIARKIIGGNNIVDGLGTYVTDVVNNVLASDIGSKLIFIIPITLLLMLMTFLAYSLLAGVLASMTTNIEDFQQLQTPIMIVSVAGYYLSMMAGMFEGSVFIRILSYVPLISAILSPSLLMLGQIGLADVVIAVLLMIGFIYLLIKYGLRIYKVGILNYSSKDLWKKMFKAIKN